MGTRAGYVAKRAVTVDVDDGGKGPNRDGNATSGETLLLSAERGAGVECEEVGLSRKKMFLIEQWNVHLRL